MGYNLLMAHKLEKGHCSLRLGARGRLVLPAEVCRTLALKEGDRILLTMGKDGRITLRSLASAIDSLQGMFRHLNAGGSMADELIRDRREEVAREEAEG
jgi:AbrB family looped-hinge helix DNA binding protein